MGHIFNNISEPHEAGDATRLINGNDGKAIELGCLVDYTFFSSPFPEPRREDDARMIDRNLYDQSYGG